jgi:adenosylcobinamide-phosphate synthase
MTLVLAMILDAIFGEPRWLWARWPHPAVLMGRLIDRCDRRFNTGPNRRAKGIAVIAALSLGAALLGALLAGLPGHLVDLLVVAVLLAQRSLVDHVRAVAAGLRLSLGEGKRAVAMIVGRDTAAMDRAAVARSAIESAAENLSDGVIAPIFWYLVAGLPGVLIYKLVNTADSMIGYRTERYADFGWAAARFDDLLNLIPARLTAALIWAVTGRPDPAAILREAPLHRSPNAGWPEAAMAHGLNIALSGPRSYDGQIKDYPFVNAAGRHDLTAHDIDTAARTLWKTWAAMLVIAILAAL